MHHFVYKDGVLHGEEVNLEVLAAEVGTPFYCYSEATLRRHLRIFRKAFDDVDALIAYSIKANSNVAVIKILAEEGAGADVVSGGELKRARAAGIPAAKIVFSGVGKTHQELALALDEGIYQFNVESEPELDALNEIALSKAMRAPIAFRVNPDVKAGGHEKISTGKREDKFGIPWTRSRDLYSRASSMKGIDVKGVDIHIGSQISELAPFEAAFKKTAELVTTLRADGCAIERVDLGGGLGIPYGPNAIDPPHPDEYANMIKRIAAPLNVQLILEPGRMIVGNAGVLISRVIYMKDGDEKRFLIIDAGMNDLLRPALYDAYHDILPVSERTVGSACQDYDVVGPICETGDRFVRTHALPEMNNGDLVAIMSTGAYGAVQTSEYNSRPLIPEVLVSGALRAIIRVRPTIDDMLMRERMPSWLNDGRGVDPQPGRE